MFFTLIVVSVASVVWLIVFSYKWWKPVQKGVPVLMYHKISENFSDALTVTSQQLREHLNYLKSENYQFVTAADVAQFYCAKHPLPAKPILLTFDDAHVSQLKLAYPLLRELGVRATIFVATDLLGQNHPQHGDIATINDIQQLDRSVFEIALHSHAHRNFRDLSLDEIGTDLQANLDALARLGVPFTPVLAYPYGGRPKNASILRGMKQLLAQKNILLAFRIGNRINPLAVSDVYELNRIDVRGTDSFDDFALKIKKGKITLF